MDKLNNNLEDKTKELSNILDKDYFHVNVSYNEKCIGLTEWSIYYKNLNDEDYWSEENKALLTSKQNGIADIYKLKDCFENIKKEYYNKKAVNILIRTSSLYWLLYKIKEKSYKDMLRIYYVYMIAFTIASVIIKNIILSVVNMAMTILGAIILIIQNKKTSELMSEKRNEIVEMILKEEMRKDGKEILKRLEEGIKNDF